MTKSIILLKEGDVVEHKSPPYFRYQVVVIQGNAVAFNDLNRQPIFDIPGRNESLVKPLAWYLLSDIQELLSEGDLIIIEHKKE